MTERAATLVGSIEALRELLGGVVAQIQAATEELPLEALFDAPLAPGTRNVHELVIALRMTEDELWFQSRRLKDAPRQTDNERDFLGRLATQYREAAFAVRTLRRYHEGRIASGRIGRPREQDDAGGIDSRGAARAHVGG